MDLRRLLRPSPWLALPAIAGVVALVFAFRSSAPDEEPGHPPPRCDATDWQACDNDAQRIEASDRETAASFYAKACAGNFALACTHQGMLEERADKPLEALKTYGAACDRGNLLGCTHLGKLFEHGVDWRITVDFSKALKLYKRACEGGEGYACVLLAETHEHSHGVAPNDFKETALYIKGCEKRNALSCWRLSQRYRAGRGARKNDPKANELQARACRDGCAEACGESPQASK